MSDFGVQVGTSAASGMKREGAQAPRAQELLQATTWTFPSRSKQEFELLSALAPHTSSKPQKTSEYEPTDRTAQKKGPLPLQPESEATAKLFK